MTFSSESRKLTRKELAVFVGLDLYHKYHLLSMPSFKKTVLLSAFFNVPQS
jgi:hypothetical protein